MLDTQKDSKTDVPAWELWWRWTTASTIGGVTAIFVGWILLNVSLAFGPLAIIFGIVALFVPGYILGWFQTLALPFTCQPYHRWTLATLTGWISGGLVVLIASIGGYALQVSFSNVPNAPTWTYLLDGGLYVGLGFGVLLGFMQTLVLREYSPRAWWWILASAIGWTVGAGMGAFIEAITMFSSLSWLLALSLYSAGTGLLLPWILKKR
jgi:hypothetical protein